MRPPLQRLVSLALVCAAIGYALLASSYSALITPLDRDEHQFLASACLVARAGLQPYRDFAYFHVPNLVYLYAPFCWSEHPFLWARLFNGACAFALCLIIFCVVRRRWQRCGNLVAAAAVILFCNGDIFKFTAGKIWNHSSGALCALLAILALLRRWFFASGLLLGMALGIRLSFAPLVLPFLLAIFVGAQRWRRLLLFGAGGAIANLPSIYFCLTSGDNFRFAQFGYRTLNRLYLKETAPGFDPGLAIKLQQLLQDLRADLPSAAIFVIALLGISLLAVDAFRGRAKVTRETWFLAALLPFLFIGSLAPKPVHEQYWFQLLPFLLLLGLLALGQVQARLLSIFGGAVLLLFAVLSLPKHPNFDKLRQRKGWTPHRVARAAAEIRDALPRNDEPVLTLSPIYLIEAGLPFVSEFATGPFAWRVSHFVSSAEAARRKMPWAPGIVDFLRTQPLRGVVTGKDHPKHENELVAALQAAGYRATPTADGALVWQASLP